eukprot:3523844-Prymnesium_polylepis.1
MLFSTRRSSGPGCAHPLRFVAGAMRRCTPAEPAAGGKPVHIMQNVADDLLELDGAAEPHDLNGDAGDRADCLVDDVLGAGGAARSALALLAPPCRLWGRVGWVGL